MKHTTQCYMLKRGAKYTITAYYDEGGYYQYECDPPKRLKTEKDWVAFKADIAERASKNFDKRVLPKSYAVKSKKSKAPKRASDQAVTKPSSKKPHVKYTAKNNPLLRKR